MHRNAIPIGLSLLLCLTAFVWTGASIAQAPTPATPGHDAAVRQTITLTRSPVRSTRKKRRIPLVAVVVTPSAPALLPIVESAAITDAHKTLINRALLALPTGCRDHLKNFSILYKDAARRGLGGKTTIILDGSVADSELVALLVHECGHVIHGNLQGTSKSGLSVFRDGIDAFYADSPMVTFWSLSWTNETTKLKGATDSDFVSGYATSDAFEDFSETFAAYVLQRDMLEARAETNTIIAKKLAWMQANLPIAEDSVGKGSAVWNGKVPWDVTRLPMTLVDKQ